MKKTILGILALIMLSVSCFAAGNDADTVLLLHMDSDQSSSEHINIQANGDPVLNINDYKWDGSMYFDGDGDYLTIPDSDDWDFGTEEWAIDFWINMQSTDGMAILDNGGYSNGVRLQQDSSSLFGVWVAGSYYTFSWTPSVDDWYHVAVIRDGNNLKVFVDGSQIGSSQDISGKDISVNLGLSIGRVLTGSAFDLDGHLDELRISKGTDRGWGSGFTPSTNEYIADGYTKLLLHLDGDNAAGASDDHDATMKGSIQMDPSEPANGDSDFDGSFYFDGYDYLSFSDSSDWDFGSEDFTIDFWFKRSDTGTKDLIMKDNSGSNFYIRFDGNDVLRSCLVDSGDGVNYALAGAVTDTNWHHLAWVRYDDTLTLYLDGVAGGTTADLTGKTAKHTNSVMNIGYGGDGFFKGYMDEVRISKGTARWTSDFTPPDEPYSGDQGGPGDIIPEFSTIGMIIAIWVAILGISFVIRKRK